MATGQRNGTFGRIAFFLFAVFMATILLAAPARAGKERPLARLKLATLAPQGSTYHKILLRLAQDWRKAPGGGVQLRIYPDGVMGGEEMMVKAMRIRKIDMAMMTGVGLAEIDDSVASLQSMPMIFRSLDEVKHVRDEMKEEIEKRFEEKGYVLLSLEDAGWINLFANKPAKIPADFQGLKIFAGSANPKSMQIWKAAGFTPAALDATDIIPGLKTGMIDAVPMPPTYALAGQVYHSAPYMLNLNWVPLIGGIVVKKETWNRLPEETRSALRDAAQKAGQDLMDQTREENQKAIDAMKEHGLTVFPVTDEVDKAWRETMDKVYPTIRGDVVPAEFFDRVSAILDEYRKQKS